MSLSVKSEYLTPREAADYARVSVRTVHRWAAGGLLKKFRAGGVVRFRRGDVDKMLAAGGRL